MVKFIYSNIGSATTSTNSPPDLSFLEKQGNITVVLLQEIVRSSQRHMTQTVLAGAVKYLTGGKSSIPSLRVGRVNIITSADKADQECCPTDPIIH